MPGLIKILDDKVVSQIAAGEVIEGPYAVLKELVENSLDAGALAIEVAIETGGKTLVRVTDDGLGMSEDDLKVAFQRHSTSKIRTLEDLQSIATLGFRGEALSSITSVSRVEALSRLQGTNEGFRIVLEGEKIVEFSPAGCAEGTTISMRDLFFNTPARKKFLKSDTREGDKCLAMFRALALSRPKVEWKYFQDDKLKIHLPTADMRDRIGGIMGNAFLEGMTQVDFLEGDYKIEGFISDKSHYRKTREHQYLFLNGRRINDRKLGYFIYNAYEKMVKAGEYPCYFLFLEMEPREIDVNVHPTKIEVRFHREYEVCGFVRRSVQKALGMDVASTFVSLQKPGYKRLTTFPGKQIAITLEDYGKLFEKPETPADETQKLILAFPPIQSEGEEGSYIPRGLFQLQAKYIVTQIKSGLVVFDQHAVHERILFEKALEGLVKSEFPSQQLLFPRLIEFAIGEESSFEELLPFLLNFGFEIKPFGPRTYLVEAVPAGLKISDEAELLRQVLDYYRENDEKWEQASQKAAAAFACKAAIKADEVLTPEEMVGLIEALFRANVTFACPHGRPTYIKIDLEELDRRFGRG